MEVLGFIMEMLATLIESIVYTMFLHIYMGNKKKNNRIAAAGLVALLFVMGFYLTPYPAIQLILYPAVLITYSVVFLNAKVRQAAAISIFMLVDTLIINLVTTFGGMALLNLTNMSMFIMPGSTRIVLLGINRIFFVITMYLALRFVIRKRILRKEEWILIALYFLADMVIAITLIIWTAIHEFSTHDYVIIFLVMLCVIAITFISLIMINQIGLKNQYSQQNEIYNMKLQAQRQEIVQLNEEYDNIRKIRHDMVKHLNIYMRLLNDGNYDELKKAIGAHIDDCGKNRYVYITKNDIINSVINEKAAVCRQKEIELEIKISATAEEKAELDIAVMLSNLLDNAIEAQEKLDSETKRYILLNIFSYQNKYSVLVKNTIFESVLDNNPQFLTDKQDTNFHGIGMKSIEDTVEKHGGYIERYEENGMFCVHIML